MSMAAGNNVIMSISYSLPVCVEEERGERERAIRGGWDAGTSWAFFLHTLRDMRAAVRAGAGCAAAAHAPCAASLPPTIFYACVLFPPHHIFHNMPLPLAYSAAYCKAARALRLAVRGICLRTFAEHARQCIAPWNAAARSGGLVSC